MLSPMEIIPEGQDSKEGESPPSLERNSPTIEENVEKNWYYFNGLTFLTTSYVEDHKLLTLNENNIPYIHNDHNRYIFRDLCNGSTTTIQTGHPTIKFQSVYLLERIMNIFILRLIAPDFTIFKNDFISIFQFIKRYIISETNRLQDEDTPNIDSYFLNRFNITLDVYIPSNCDASIDVLFGDFIPYEYEEKVKSTFFSEPINESTKYIFNVNF